MAAVDGDDRWTFEPRFGRIGWAPMPGMEVTMGPVTSEMFQHFSAKVPMPLMARLVLERALPPEKVDAWFAESRVRQYTRDLLFSSVFELMSLVAVKVFTSTHAAYQANKDAIGVSVTSVYNKINAVDGNTSRAVVRESAVELGKTIKALKGERPALLPGYRAKLLDGNCLEATEHRLAVLRTTPAGALPGKSLVVYDPSWAMAIDVFPCEDGHAQERALLGEVLSTVEERDLWIWDRNFCVRDFLAGIQKRKGRFIGRHHKGLVYTPLGPERFAGRTETGTVYEQLVEVGGSDDRRPARYRLIRISLKKATRDSDTELRLLTNLSKSAASAKHVAELYRRRWEIETTFQKLESYLHSEVNSLGYPKAALFAFCVALVAYNVLAVVAAALRRVHGDDVIAQKVSGFYIAGELSRGHLAVNLAIRPLEWSRLRKLSDAAHCDLLLTIAATADLSKYKKHVRGPKKPRPTRTEFLDKPHVSTARLLRDRK
jgi:IS4 transposase